MRIIPPVNAVWEEEHHRDLLRTTFAFGGHIGLGRPRWKSEREQEGGETGKKTRVISEGEGFVYTQEEKAMVVRGSSSGSIHCNITAGLLLYH